MATIKRFEDIETWQKARVLANKIYEVSASTELAKDYKLRDQINTSAGSIMDNIAEGFERSGKIRIHKLSQHRERISRRNKVSIVQISR